MSALLSDSYKYKEIPLITMEENNNGNLPVFVRIYDMRGITTKLHRHQFIQINYILGGKAKHLINQAEFSVMKGDIFIIPPYIPHKIIPIENSSVDIVELEFVPELLWSQTNAMEEIESFFDFAYIEPFLVSEGEIKPRLNISGKTQIVVENLLDEIYTEYNKRTNGYLLAIKADLLKLLVYVGRCYHNDMVQTESGEIFEHHREAISRAISYSNQNFTKDLKVEDVAKTAMLSRSYFCYLFKTITGKTFIEYLNELRINKASEMLRNTQIMITDICYDSGFNSISHFNRVFKSITGISPRHYRLIYSNSRVN